MHHEDTAEGLVGDIAMKTKIATTVVLLAVALSWTMCDPLTSYGQPSQSHSSRVAEKGKSQSSIDEQVKAEQLVELLQSNEFQKREVAEKALVVLGSNAIPAVRAGLKSRDPEVVQRCERLLALIRKEELTKFSKAFAADTDRTARFEHPIWNRYVRMVGDCRPSREFFAAILKHDDWARTLDHVEADPANAGELYRAAVRDVGRRYTSNTSVGFLIPIWPCDQPEEVAYLLLLGSYKATDPTEPLSFHKAQDRQFADGESRIRAGRGLGLAFQGTRLDIDPKKLDRAIVIDDKGGNSADSARVMLMLLGHWLEQRNLWKIVAEHLRGLSAEQEKQFLPFARRVIADKEAPILCRAAWIRILRRFGDKSDAVRLAPLFADKSGMDWPSTTRFGDGPGNLINQAQVREVAIGSALFLRGRDPDEFGFTCLANQRPAKKRDDDIHSTLFTVMPTGTNEEKDKVLAAAIQWLEKDWKADKPLPQK
jgi:hypothetical protein